MKLRKAQVERKTSETEIRISLKLDGQGKSRIKTNVGILDHMLQLFAFHGLFDLDISVVKADLNIDIHHTNEDLGIVLAKAFKEALGEKEGIRRFGYACAPMEATLAYCIVDISGRGYLKFSADSASPSKGEVDGYAFSYLEHFLESFAHTLGATIHVRIKNVSDDLHTNLETVFKSLGIALDAATQIDTRRKGIPSTKGIID